MTNVAGCDSVVTLNLTINTLSAGIATITTCDSYTWIDGITYTASNTTATHTLTNVAGCDSVVTLNLTINTVDTTVQQSGNIFTAAISDTYQWIDCATGLFVDGATEQSFSPTMNGNYAVIVELNGCSDTSSCYSFNSASVQKVEKESVNLYPNPSSGSFSLIFSSIQESVEVKIVQIDGQLIGIEHKTNAKEIFFDKEFAPGTYYLIINIGTSTLTEKLIIN